MTSSFSRGTAKLTILQRCVELPASLLDCRLSLLGNCFFLATPLPLRESCCKSILAMFASSSLTRPVSLHCEAFDSVAGWIEPFSCRSSKAVVSKFCLLLSNWASSATLLGLILDSASLVGESSSAVLFELGSLCVLPFVTVVLPELCVAFVQGDFLGNRSAGCSCTACRLLFWLEDEKHEAFNSQTSYASCFSYETTLPCYNRFAEKNTISNLYEVPCWDPRPSLMLRPLWVVRASFNVIVILE